jgi:hypothetical protein
LAKWLVPVVNAPGTTIAIRTFTSFRSANCSAVNASAAPRTMCPASYPDAAGGPGDEDDLA